MRRTRSKNFILFAGSLALIAFALLPVVWMVWISFSSRPDFLFGEAVSYSWDSYGEILTSSSYAFPDYFANSIIVAFLTALCVTILTALAAYALTRMSFPGKTVIPLFILALSMFPPISIVGYLHRLFSEMGLLNTHTALILPYMAMTIPLSLWINMSYFQQIPPELDHAAQVDGASRLTILYRIILPLALPGLFCSALLVFIACFNEFLFALMLTMDLHAQTLPVGIAMFEGLHGETPWGHLMAASTLTTLPLVILTLFFQKHIVSGLTGGAVKG